MCVVCGVVHVYSNIILCNIYINHVTMIFFYIFESESELYSNIFIIIVLEVAITTTLNTLFV